MAQLVCSGAMMMCSFGLAPGALIVLPQNRTMAGGPPAANIMDHLPIANIPPFGMCQSIANPTVAAATAAAMGALTPMPCVPLVPTPWMPGSPTVLIGGMPALTSTSQCTCAWAGVITITAPGQATVMVP
jgi:uncharacterized Zn-binding protein involved in type VI secretion